MHDSGDVRKALDALSARRSVVALYLVRRHGDAPWQAQEWAKDRYVKVTVMTDPDDLARLQLDGVVSFGDADALRDRLRAAGLAVWEPLRMARRRIAWPQQGVSARAAYPVDLLAEPLHRKDQASAIRENKAAAE